MESKTYRHRGERRIYMHNDLANAAFHFQKSVNGKLAAGDREGITFECLACLTMLAFTFEARINFLGSKLDEKWKEKKPFPAKLDKVISRLKMRPNWHTRPYSSISALKKFRDSVAHGKPQEYEIDTLEHLTEDEKVEVLDLKSEWEKLSTQENVNNIFEDVDAIWADMLDQSGIEPYETITHGKSSLDLVQSEKTSSR